MYDILMCKDKKVYNIETGEVYNENLLPGCMLKNPCNETFNYWIRLRYSSNSNMISRNLKGSMFGQGKRSRINKQTRALSLSDCYWIKDDYENTKFLDVTPYSNVFWKGKDEYNGESVPTLYVGGYLTKEWATKELLYKHTKKAELELECINLCILCGISVEYGFLKDKNIIAVCNITDEDVMLEQADQSGKIDPEDFNEYDIIKLFSIDGLRMLVVDAVIGNCDRHSGNFGFLRDSNSGEYLRMAPLYDFDHALDSNKLNDYIITDLVTCLKELKNKLYMEETIRICNIIIESESSNNIIFKMRAKSIIDSLVYYLI